MHTVLARTIIFALNLVLIAAGSALLAAEEAGRTVHFFDDFEGEFKPFVSGPEADSTVSGLFPQQWSENSIWKGAAVEVVYDRLTTAAHQGAASWRIDCRAVHAGRSQMGISPVPLDGRRFIELNFAARSDHASSFRMAINMSGTPWTTYWQQDVGLTSEWQTYRFLIPPSAVDPKSRFQIVLDRPARIDLDNFSISYLEPELVIGDGDPKGNLLAQAAFTQGVAGAWVSEPTDRPDFVYRRDSTEIGPSGYPSLRIEADPQLGGRPMTQITQAFRCVGGRTYTASAWVKGAPGQAVHLRVGPPAEQLWAEPWQKNVQLSGEWQRVSLAVDLPFTPDGVHLFRMTCHGSQPYWLDACQVEVGDQASPWQLSGATPSEVVVTSPQNRGLHLGEGDLEAVVHITANTEAGAQIVGSLTDIRGQEVEIAPKRLARGSLKRLRSVPLTLPTDSLAQWGTYLLRVRIEDANGAALSRWAEYSLSRVRLPKADRLTRPNSAFGIHTRYGDSDLQLAQDLGFTWVRTLYDTNWNSVQPNKNAWDWNLLDWRIKQIEKYDFSVLGSLSGAPRWATNVPDDYRAWSHMNFEVRDLSAWQQFAEKIATRYRRQVTYWEIWNEPYWPHF